MAKLTQTITAISLFIISSLSPSKANNTEVLKTIASKYSTDTISQFYKCDANALINVEANKATLNTVKYFGTSVTITVFNQPQSQAKKQLCHALNVIQEYHFLASNYSTYPHVTNIKTINESPTDLHQIDPLLTDLLAQSIAWHDKSQGYFNIALSPVIDLWREKRFACMKAKNKQTGCQIPTQHALEQAAQFTQITDIKLDTKQHNIRLKQGMKIDLGGIAKGWMTEKVFQQLVADGVNQFMIDAGGNIRHKGLHPQQRLFATAIEDPLCKKSEYQLATCANFDGQYHEVIAGENITVVSSGNYLRYFEVGGKQYHHLIDPTTLAPKSTGVATTVILDDNQIYADVISTSLFLMPLEQAIAFANKHDYIEAVWYLNEQGDKVTSESFDKYRLTPQ
ncbi:FAD:protein FMN transferase [Shewanella maritima]|uniref:FAD:protein FMN transferase n=1 Tax=Shewanella maritima TaxID=2520507 RepID=UPI003735D1C5